MSKAKKEETTFSVHAITQLSFPNQITIQLKEIEKGLPDSIK